MKVKTSKLDGLALDWAVAQADGKVVRIVMMGYVNCLLVSKCVDLGGGDDYWMPSETWAQGGPIIDREKISIDHWSSFPRVRAYMYFDGAEWSEDGASTLIAAMRCYVSSRIGKEVEIPDELYGR